MIKLYVWIRLLSFSIYEIKHDWILNLLKYDLYLVTNYFRDSEDFGNSKGSGKQLLCFWNLCFLNSPIYSRVFPCHIVYLHISLTVCSVEIGRKPLNRQSSASRAKRKLAVFIHNFAVSRSLFLSRHTKEGTAFSTMVCVTHFKTHVYCGHELQNVTGQEM